MEGPVDDCCDVLLVELCFVVIAVLRDIIGGDVETVMEVSTVVVVVVVVVVVAVVEIFIEVVVWILVVVVVGILVVSRGG